MAKYASKELVVEFDGTDVSEYGASLDVDENEDAVDTTGFGQDDGEYIPSGVTHRKASLAGFDDTAGTVYGALEPGESGSLTWYPQGNTAGKPKLTATAHVTNRKRGFAVGDKVALTAEFQISGAVTETTV